MNTLIRHLIPNVGTFILAGLLFLAQSVGALPNSASSESTAPSQTVISYQGTLADSEGTPVNETVIMEFALYDAPVDGNQLWESGTQSVEVSDGLFYVLLGGGGMTPIDPAFLEGDLYLDIQVNGEALSPRELLTSVAYALEAETLSPGATTQGALKLGGNLNLQTHDINNVNDIAAGDSDANFLLTNSHGNIRLRSAGHLFFFLDMDNDSTDAIFKVVKDNVDMNPPASTVFAVEESGEITAYGNLDMNARSVTNARNVLGEGSQKIHMPAPGDSIYMNWGSGDKVVFGGGDTSADVSIGPTGITMHGKSVTEARNVLGEGSQKIHMPAPGDSIYMNWGSGDKVVFGGGDTTADVSITPTGINLHGNSVTNCGALIEANLQTSEELAGERINRFEEGDVLCWGDGQLEKCDQTGDPLVQAVADANGRPIVIGAELVRVIGPVKKGDFLVASDVPGYAMTARSPAFGTVIAQALEDFEGDRGTIKAMIRKM